MPMYNRYKRNRKRSGKDNWGWQSALQGAVSGGARGYQVSQFSPDPYSKALITAGSALAGGVVGGLGGGSSTVDREAYDMALDQYEHERRRGARVAGDELSAQTGASLAARGVNNSALAAGMISANRGRLAGQAEQDIGRFRSQIEMQIADAEAQAQMAQDAYTREGWLDLGKQLAWELAAYEVRKKIEAEKKKQIPGTRDSLIDPTGNDLLNPTGNELFYQTEEDLFGGTPRGTASAGDIQWGSPPLGIPETPMIPSRETIPPRSTRVTPRPTTPLPAIRQTPTTPLPGTPPVSMLRQKLGGILEDEELDLIRLIVPEVDELLA